MLIFFFNNYFYTVLALAFVPLGSTGVYWSAIRFHFNIYTGPGYLSALLAVINILLVIFVFKDRKLITRNFKKMKTFARKRESIINIHVYRCLQSEIVETIVLITLHAIKYIIYTLLGDSVSNEYP